MQDFISLKIIAESLSNSLEPEWGCYIDHTLPNELILMRFNFPVVLYFHHDHVNCVSHVTGEVFRIEYADKEAYPDILIGKINEWKDGITNKSEEFPASCFNQDCLDYITKNIQ